MIAALLEQAGVTVPQRRGWVSVKCPFHDDSTASARLSDDEDLFFCHGCGVKGNTDQITNKLKEEGVDIQDIVIAAPERGKKVKSKVMSPTARRELERAIQQYVDQGKDSKAFQKYWAGRGFTKEDALANQIGYVDRPVDGHELFRGRLCIPYLTPTGAVTARFRSIDGTEPKYMGIPGHPTRLFGATNLANPYNEVIVITEGEIDAITLTKVGIPSVGIPGATNWKSHYNNLFEGFTHVWVVGDGDKAGRDFIERVADGVPWVRPVYIGDGLDINSIYTTYGEEAVQSLFKLEEVRHG